MELVFLSIMGDCVCKIVVSLLAWVLFTFGFVCLLVGGYWGWVYFW